jgi:hypothetical protein
MKWEAPEIGMSINANSTAKSPTEAQARFVSKPAICLRYGVCSRTIENWMRSKMVPFLRIGKRGVRFDPEACDRALSRFIVKEVQ